MKQKVQKLGHEEGQFATVKQGSRQFETQSTLLTLGLALLIVGLQDYPTDFGRQLAKWLTMAGHAVVLLIISSVFRVLREQQQALDQIGRELKALDKKDS